jgi:hypothetical protein
MIATEKRTKRWELLFTPSEREALTKAASWTRRTEASIVRQALEEWLERRDGTEPSQNDVGPACDGAEPMKKPGSSEVASTYLSSLASSLSARPGDARPARATPVPGSTL